MKHGELVRRQAVTLPGEASDTLLELLGMSMAPSTQKKYEECVRVAQRRGLDVENLTDFSLAMYVAKIKDLGQSAKTAQIHICALKHLYRVMDKPFPAGLLTRQALMGFRRHAESHGSGKGQVDPIRWDMLEQVCDQLDKSSNIAARRDSAWFSLASDCLLRASEVSAVRCEHVQMKSDLTGMLEIPKRKNDQHRKGTYRFIRAKTMGRMQAWQEIANVYDGFLFRRFWYNGRGKPNVKEMPIKRKWMFKTVKQRFKKAGFPGRFGSHSFRVGSAVELLERGATDLELMQDGGWANIQMTARYVQQARASRSATARHRFDGVVE